MAKKKPATGTVPQNGAMTREVARQLLEEWNNPTNSSAKEVAEAMGWGTSDKAVQKVNQEIAKMRKQLASLQEQGKATDVEIRSMRTRTASLYDADFFGVEDDS